MRTAHKGLLAILLLALSTLTIHARQIGHGSQARDTVVSATHRKERVLQASLHAEAFSKVCVPTVTRCPVQDAPIGAQLLSWAPRRAAVTQTRLWHPRPLHRNNMVTAWACALKLMQSQVD
jgi:hypothetical protein